MNAPTPQPTTAPRVFPADPCHCDGEPVGGTHADAGMMLADYFAAHAPGVVPDWFVHRWTPQEPRPTVDHLSPDDQRRARAWLHDPIYDLSDDPESDLYKYQQAIEAWRSASMEHERMDAAVRFFQWRWYYANMMLHFRTTGL